MSETITLVIEAKDKASGVLEGVGGGLARIGEFALGGLLANGLSRIGGGLLDLASGGIETNAQLEQLEISFGTLLAREMDLAAGSDEVAAAAEGMIDWIMEAAKATPFETDQVAKVMQMAMAYGFSSEAAQGLTMTVSDVAAGLGLEGDAMQGIIAALGQMQAKGKITGEEMLQLTERGIPAWALLSDAMGMPVDELQEAVTKGILPFDAAMQGLIGQMGAEFEGAGARQSRTFQGLKSTMSDYKDMALAAFTQPVFERLTEGAASLVDEWGPRLLTFAEHAGAAFGEWLTNTTAWVSDKLLPGLATLWEWIQGSLVPAIETLWSWVQENLLPAFGGLTEGAGGLSAAVATAWEWFNTKLLPVLQDVAGFLAENVVPIVQEVTGFLLEMFGRIVGWVQDNWPLIQATIETVLDAVWAVIQWVLGQIETFWNQHGEKIMGLVETVWNMIKTVVENVLSAIGHIVKAIMLVIQGDWEGAWEQVKAALGDIWEAITAVINTALEAVKTWLGIALSYIQELWGTVWGAVKSKVEEVWNGIKGFLEGIWDGIKGAAETAWALIQAFVEDPMRVVDTTIRTLWEELHGHLEGIWDGIKGTAERIWENIKELLGGAFDGMRQRWSDAFSGVADAIKGPLNAVLRVVEDVINAAIDGLNGLIDAANMIPGVELGHVDHVSLPRLHEGGFINSGEMLAVVRGNEAVLPLDSPRTVDVLADALAKAVARAGGAARGLVVYGDVTIRAESDEGRQILRELMALA